MKCILSVAAHSQSKGTKLLVLLLVASMRNLAGHSRPTVPLLARLTRMSEQTIREALDSLCESHDLARVEDGGGKGKGATYRVLVRGEAPAVNRLPDGYFPPHS